MGYRRSIMDKEKYVIYTDNLKKKLKYSCNEKIMKE